MMGACRWLALPFALLAAVALAACDGSVGRPAVDDMGATPGVGDTASVGDDASGAPAAAVESTRVYVITTIGFEREEPAGVALGFDLDDRVSESGDPQGCRARDFTAPDGTPGIDNQMAKLLPVVDQFGENALQTLVQGAIDEGRTMLMILIEGIDDPVNDDDITLTIRRGIGSPLLGTDGKILPGQTLDLADDPPLGRFEGAKIVDGAVEAGPFEVTLPAVVFNVQYVLPVPQGYVRFRFDEYGALQEGVMAGGVPLSAVNVILEQADGAVGDDIVGLVGPLLRGMADLAPDERGQCTEMSATLSFVAVPAWLFDEGVE